MGMLMLAAVARQRGYRVHLIDAKGHGHGARRGAPAHRGAAARLPRPVGDDHLGDQRGAHRRGRQGARCRASPRSSAAPHVSAVPERTLERLSRASTTASPARARWRCSRCSTRLERERGGRRPRPASPIAAARGCTANPRAPYIDDLDTLPTARLGPAAGLPAPLPADRCSATRARRWRRSSPRAAVPSPAPSATAPPPAAKGACTASSTVVALCRELAERGARHILFLDDLFTVRKQRVVDLCQALIEASASISPGAATAIPTCSTCRRCS